MPTGNASRSPLGHVNYTSSDNYHYILEVGSTGTTVEGTVLVENVDAVVAGGTGVALEDNRIGMANGSDEVLGNTGTGVVPT